MPFRDPENSSRDPEIWFRDSERSLRPSENASGDTETPLRVAKTQFMSHLEIKRPSCKGRGTLVPGAGRVGPKHSSRRDYAEAPDRISCGEGRRPNPLVFGDREAVSHESSGGNKTIGHRGPSVPVPNSLFAASS